MHGKDSPPSFRHVSKMDVTWDLGIDHEFRNAIYIHYFTNIRLFASTDKTLFVICPITKTILREFELKGLYEMTTQRLMVNWSGEEIYLSNETANMLDENYILNMYYFSENEEKHYTLASFARRAVLTTYTMTDLQSFKLPTSVKNMLGVL